MTLRNQIKIYHWQTFSYARHKSTDELVSQLDSTIDQFVETGMGLYQQRPIFAQGSTLEIVTFVTDEQGMNLINKLIQYLRSLKLDDPALLNLRDEFLSKVYQQRYLFTLE